MKGIYRFYVDFDRMGELEGIFISTEEEVDNIIGKKVWFGEVLGKHSEVGGVIEEGEIELITEDIGPVSMFNDYALETGFNPFNYINDETFEDKE